MKSTIQRDTILKVLTTAHQALSPEELLGACQASIPQMGIATVHRSLKYLREENKIEEVTMPGDILRFCFKGKHHHYHFKCQGCNKVYDIDCGGMDIKLPAGFKKTAYELNVVGICKQCAL